MPGLPKDTSDVEIYFHLQICRLVRLILATYQPECRLHGRGQICPALLSQSSEIKLHFPQQCLDIFTFKKSYLFVPVSGGQITSNLGRKVGLPVVDAQVLKSAN